MRFYADLHIHSKYSRACSKDCDIEHLTWWARRKGVGVVGTGDFTHPAWFAHLREVLEPAEPGLFRLRADLDRDISRTLPASCRSDVRFMLSVEISTIYKAGERTRKVHHLCYMPDFAAAERFNERLGRIGNLGSDGRPILGLDSRDLLEITLESGDGAYLVPAHIWTPWFAAMGSKAGFDSIADCYRDLSGHIFALETGLSSDPEMNWRLSQLDGFTLVSNSDAHSPPMLAREASAFDTELDYFSIRRALETGTGYEGTVEFFPEEGKYHLDGHRKCDVRLEPAETKARGGLCPACGKPVTVGVLHRVDDLADRPEGVRPEGAAGFRNLIPLPEIVSEIVGVGPKSKKVLGRIATLTAEHGSELAILDDVPTDDLERGLPGLGEAISRLRAGTVIRDAGYDGEYGRIHLFAPDELTALRTADAPALFDAPAATPARRASSRPAVAPRTAEVTVAVTEPSDDDRTPPPLPPPDSGGSGVLAGLDPDQRTAAAVESGPLLIVAGPGTGKTRTVTHRLAHLVTERSVPPEECLAITFTRRAAEEMSERMAGLVGAAASDLTVATFHSFGFSVIRDHHELLGLPPTVGIADATVADELLTSAAGDRGLTSGSRRALSLVRRGEAEPDADTAELLATYSRLLRERGLVDYDDLLLLPVELLGANPEVRAAYRDRYRWVTVDEYQDVDAVQYRLLRLLCPPDANLTAIGDPDQAIYSFRGADVGFFLRFERDYPTAPVVRLTRNYRSGPPIVEAALRAIRPSTLVADRELHATRTEVDHPLTVHQVEDERAEAAYVARTIESLLGGSSLYSLDSGRATPEDGHEISFADIAVLYRTDAQARAVVEELGRCGLPSQKRSHDPLTARAGVEHILRELVHVSDGATGDVLAEVRSAAAAAERTLASDSASEGADERVAEVHVATELLSPLARRYGTDLGGFVREVLLGAEVDALDARADAISLLTLHAAKGLEFPVVFVVGCEDGLLPLRWPGTEPDEASIAEERRLCFVGMTRAQDHLYLTHARRRSRMGRVEERRVSPFLDDLGDRVRRTTLSKPRSADRQLRLL
ncbi:UvrD-helicase domain-containing protein [Spiractinospora alimapuensis]|uniref:UvrD-helicase domain-containing protein n=1 Tax=Spiractinospora alimapuensis TaxID=2820884 RepID=UPI001F41EEA1|nr:UvrD-helicase domain-containing protein [Spiractinospora alimapuensis]QVQ50391.1 UvrD-helicase domain-containing protein [Spiractinospora alimapuensis]